MKKILTLSIFFLITIFLASPSVFSDNRLSNIKSWVIFYGDKLPKGLHSYDLYIFASKDHPSLENIETRGKKVVGYLSIGEITDKDPHFKQTKRQRLLVDENENWPGSFRLKIGDKKWKKIVLNKMIPKIIAKGFDGIFLDTVDTAEYLERVKKIPDQISGAIDLIKEIRKKFPKIIIVLNNGLFLIDSVGDEIDGLLVEDLYTLYDFKKREYRLAPPAWTNKRLIPMKAFQKKFKKPILPLDYLNSSDKKTIKRVAKMAESEGFIPSISDINLRTIFFHQ